MTSGLFQAELVERVPGCRSGANHLHVGLGRDGGLQNLLRTIGWSSTSKNSNLLLRHASYRYANGVMGASISILVPRPGALEIQSTSAPICSARSCMVFKPQCPDRRAASSGSKPHPSSRIRTRIRSESRYAISMPISVAWLYLTALRVASWTMREELLL